MSSVHVADPILIFEIIEKDVLLGMLAQHSEVILFGPHPIEGFDERIVRK